MQRDTHTRTTSCRCVCVSVCVSVCVCVSVFPCVCVLDFFLCLFVCVHSGCGTAEEECVDPACGPAAVSDAAGGNGLHPAQGFCEYPPQSLSVSATAAQNRRLRLSGRT